MFSKNKRRQFGHQTYMNSNNKPLLPFCFALCAVRVCPVVPVYHVINRLTTNKTYISSGRAEMGESYPFDRDRLRDLSTTRKEITIRLPKSRSCNCIPYSTSTIVIHKLSRTTITTSALRPAWRPQYNITSSRQVEEWKDVLKWKPIRFV